MIDKEGRTARSPVMLKGTSSKLSDVCQPENRVIHKRHDSEVSVVKGDLKQVVRCASA